MNLRPLFYIFISEAILMMALGYVWWPLFLAGQAMLGLLLLLCVVEAAMLWSRRGMTAFRQCSDRFSCGDDNEVALRLESSYRFPVSLDVIDEAPVEFQRRDVVFRLSVPRLGAKTVVYRLRPVRRGVYDFGVIRVSVRTAIGLVERAYKCGEPHDVKVYPSYLMLRQYELMAVGRSLMERGRRKVRRVTTDTEFEQIKDYVQGDDFRRINWRATARRSALMVNLYQEQRSRQVYCVIDKGRVMQQAFRGKTWGTSASQKMTLLDYAINASLVLSYVAMRREDRAGLVSFGGSSSASGQLGTFVPAERRQGHMQTLLETLYHEQTDFGESDFSALVAGLDSRATHHSLLVLFTNFLSMSGMRRELPFLKQLARRHKLVVVIFEDSEMHDYIGSKAGSTEEVYQHVIAEKSVYEQHLMVETLRREGILSLLTTPENLSVAVVNKYLEVRCTL